MAARFFQSLPPLCLLLLSGCGKHEADAPTPDDGEPGPIADTLALTVGLYEGVLVESSWSMPDNNSYSVDTVVLEVIVDTTQAHAINLVGLEEHMIVNPDLSLTLLPGSGYGGGSGYLLLGDSIVVNRSQGTLSWNFSHSFKGRKLD